jgi:hypothetical protein
MGGSFCFGRGSPGLLASATTWRLAVCSSNRLFLSAVCALQPRVQWGIRCDTVRRTLSRAYRRIGVRDRAQAVGWCLCHGLISRQELERRYRHQVEQGPPMEES